MRLVENDIVRNGTGRLGEVVEARNLRARVEWEGVVPTLNEEDWVTQISPPFRVVFPAWKRERLRDLPKEIDDVEIAMIDAGSRVSHCDEKVEELESQLSHAKEERKRAEDQCDVFERRLDMLKEELESLRHEGVPLL